MPKRTASGSPLLSVDSAEPRPFTHGEFPLADQPGEFVSGVEILDPFTLDQYGQHALDLFQAFLNSHATP